MEEYVNRTQKHRLPAKVNRYFLAKWGA